MVQNQIGPKYAWSAIACLFKPVAIVVVALNVLLLENKWRELFYFAQSKEEKADNNQTIVDSTGVLWLCMIRRLKWLSTKK